MGCVQLSRALSRFALCCCTIIAVQTRAVSAQGSPTAQAPRKPGPTLPVPERRGTVSVHVAVVDAEANVKPIPLHELRMQGATGDPDTTLRTGLDGRVQALMPAGGYVLSSIRPITLAGTSYRWQVAVQVSTASTVVVELTNANADSAVADAPPSTSRGIAPEMQVFGRVREGVFRVQAGIGSGTAFLVDSAGLLLTNAHVVSGVSDADLSVQLDSVTRVPAQLVEKAQEADVAVIRINPLLVQGRPLARLDTTVAPVPGERVFALGYPLGQSLTLTAGIVSSVREGAIVHDANINPGNSGGPLYALDGTVVGINTFLIADKRGPGVYGSIPLRVALPVLHAARASATSLPELATTHLPVRPFIGIPVQEVKASVEERPLDVWKTYRAIGIGRFTLSVNTPYQVIGQSMLTELEVAKDRRKREDKAGLSSEEKYSETADFHDWELYSGSTRNSLVPLVGIHIEPKLGETTGSWFRRFAIAAASGQNSKATVRYKSDLRRAYFFRNSDTLVAYMGGTHPARQYVNDEWVDLRDVANIGYYLLPVEAFAPEEDGTVPVITIVLYDLKNPDEPSCGVLKPELVAAIWNQFIGHRQAQGETAVEAIASKRRPDAGQVSGQFCTVVPEPAQPLPMR